jgi:hypothetical protein
MVSATPFRSCSVDVIAGSFAPGFSGTAKAAEWSIESRSMVIAAQQGKYIFFMANPPWRY